MQETKEKELTYDEFINNILETRGRFACGDEYHEKHHIVPRCMGGTNEENNLIDLFAREHFEAHRLLALENPDNEKLTYAWSCMAFVKKKDTDRYEVTAEEYQEVRIALSNSLKGKYFGGNMPGVPKSEKHKKKISMANKGKKRSEETRRKNGDAHRGKKYPPKSEETRRKISQSQMGKKNHRYGKHHTEEHKKMLSEMNSGEHNHFYGKHHSEDVKKQLSETKSKAVYCVETKHIYFSALIAQDNTNVCHSSIGKNCGGKQKTAGGYHWHYLYDQKLRDGTIIPGAITLGLITEEEALAQLNTQQND